MTSYQNKLNILYGSRTGNSKAVAILAEEYAKHLGLDCTSESMDKFRFETLKDIKNLLVVVSTHGEGEPPVPAEDFHAFVHSENAPKMESTRYAVLGLGDSSYRYFSQTGVDFDLQFEKLGAERLLPVEKCDIDFEEKSKKWVRKTVDKFAERIPKQEQPENKDFIFELKLDDGLQLNAYRATLLKKELLNGENASHPTMNVSFSLKDSGLDFHPGDLVGIYAANSRLLVDQLIKKMNLDPTLLVGKGENKKMLKVALIHDYELTVITPVVLEKYAKLVKNKTLNELLKDEVKVDQYIENTDVLDMVSDFPGDFKLDGFLQTLRKLTPRLYSAASYMPGGQESVDLTIRIVNNKHNNREHRGVSSSYIWNRLETGESAPIFIEKNARFRLPEDLNASVIMIAAGTGIAPFRSFLQYRDAHLAKGKNWLFFGERNSKTDFFYKDELMSYQERGLLTNLDTAFSRDSEQKHYIYHRLLEKGAGVYEWLEKGAFIYICGNKRTMANDVRNALTEIIRIQGNLTKEQTDKLIKRLRADKRLQEDIY